MYDEQFKFENLKGKTLTSIENNGDVLLFHTKEESFKMLHSQDCCESVNVEEIIGDLNDLFNSEILLAEEVSSSEPDSKTKTNRELKKAAALKQDNYYYEPESETWTFYKLSTIKGSVTIRWYGTSNGYYSESVSFYKINK